MKHSPHIRSDVRAKQKPPLKKSKTGIEPENTDMTEGEHACRISRVNLDLFAESFLKGPLAKEMLERGEPFRIFVPVQSSDCIDWGGVDITIAGVTKEQIAREQEDPARLRGNGHSSNPYGRLNPGDYGVHSHPDTAKLVKNNPGKDYSVYQKPGLTDKAPGHKADKPDPEHRRKD